MRTGTHGTTSLTIDDARAIASEIPTIARVSPQVDGSVTIAAGNRNWTTRYRGVTVDYLAIKRWTIASGAAFSDEQVERASSVCLVGETVRRQLFGDEDPTGQVIRVNAQPFEVIGGDVATRKAQWIASRCPLKLVNYELLTRDEDFLGEPDVHFDVVVLDEAQRIKNKDAKTARRVGNKGGRKRRKKYPQHDKIAGIAKLRQSEINDARRTQ